MNFLRHRLAPKKHHPWLLHTVSSLSDAFCIAGCRAQHVSVSPAVFWARDVFNMWLLYLVDSCCVSFHPLSSGFCDCLVKRVARSWHCKCWKATSWKLKPQSAGNYLGLLFALPQSVTNKYALYPCKCLAVNSIPSGWGSFLLPLPLCICLYVSRSLSPSPCWQERLCCWQEWPE